MNEIEEDKEQKQPKRKRSFLRWLFWIFIFLLFLFIAIPVLIHISPVQNWLVDKVAVNISQKTSSKVTLDAVDFSVFSGLELNDLYVSSPEMEEDTLMHVKELSTSLTESVLSVFRREVLLDKITLSEATIKIKKQKGDTLTNLRKFLLGFSSNNEQPSSNKDGLKLDLEQINFNDVYVEISDESNDDKTWISLNKGAVNIDSFSIKENVYNISNLYLLDPVVTLIKGNHETIDTKNTQAVEEVIKKQLSLPVDLRINKLEVVNGQFHLEDWNHEKSSLVKALDYHNLNVNEIHFLAENIKVSKDFSIEAFVDNMSLQEDSGFGIKNLQVEEFLINRNNVLLSGLDLNLNNSRVTNYISFQYNELVDFKDFGKKIKVVSDLKGSVIAVSDLLYFFPELKSKRFFKQNSNSVLKLSGIVNGNLKNIEADNLRLTIDNKIVLNGSISGRNLHLPQSALFNMYIDNLNTSMSDLRKVIPGFNPPAQFDKLGPIVFRGDIEGFFNDLVVYLSLIHI